MGSSLRCTNEPVCTGSPTRTLISGMCSSKTSPKRCRRFVSASAASNSRLSAGSETRATRSSSLAKFFHLPPTKLTFLPEQTRPSRKVQVIACRVQASKWSRAFPRTESPAVSDTIVVIRRGRRARPPRLLPCLPLTLANSSVAIVLSRMILPNSATDPNTWNIILPPAPCPATP